MARFVLLASPLLGPASWGPTAAELRALGHGAETPAWPRLADIEEGFYEGLAAGMAAQLVTGEAPILAAHSGAGALLPALVARLAAPPAAAVFVDAILPHPGKSWFDTAPADLRRSLQEGVMAGLLPAWHEWWPPGALEKLVPDAARRAALIAELEPIPAGFFEEPAPGARLAAPAGYLRLSGAYEDEAARASALGWPVMRLPLHHLAILTQPSAVAAALVSTAERLSAI
ncbi:MAG TPA: hypothetical protein VHV27_10185 [Phenylobacterium sp.]|jgi:hypothetical protein|nr:hypothetical protein [Phenylobacterium sp.]